MSGKSVMRFERLKKGDVVGFAAPAGPVSPERIEGSISLLESRGLKVKLTGNPRAKEGFLAGSDGRRFAELAAALADPAIKAVFLARGGYGSQRIATRLACGSASHPKPVIGFSDNTALLNFILNDFGWPALHAPHPDPEKPGEMDETLAVLMEGHKPSFQGLKTVRKGRTAVAPVAGGCLSLLSATVGTPLFPRLNGRLLFVEETGEAPYRIDRMLTHLLQAGTLGGARGIVFGLTQTFSPGGVPVGEVDSVIEDFARRAGLPVMTGLASGHVDNPRPLPLGIEARADFSAGTLEILRPLAS